MRCIIPVVLLLAVAACAEQPPEPLAPDAAHTPSASQHATSGFPVVIVREQVPTDIDAEIPVVDNLIDALDRVAAGGEIRVAEGTYAGLPAPIDKPVTIEALGNALPEIDGTGRCRTLEVEGVSGGAVVLRGLKLAGEPSCNQALVLGGTRDDVLVEEMVFERGAVGIGPAAAATGPVVIRNNAFPGPSGIFGSGAGAVEVSGNSFTGRGTVVHLGATDAVISGNTFSRCRPGSNDVGVGCIAVGGPGPGEVVGNARVEDNRITVEVQDQIPSGIFVSLGSHTITGNVITGIGRDPSAPSEEERFPMTLAGIEIVDGADAVVSGNWITNAFHGIQIGAPVTVIGTDNVIDNVYFGIASFPGSGVEIHSSDFTGYAHAMAVHGSDPTRADLTCNWWDSASGPVNATAPHQSTYTPWATEPVAGTSITECEGGP